MNLTARYIRHSIYATVNETRLLNRVKKKKNLIFSGHSLKPNTGYCFRTNSFISFMRSCEHLLFRFHAQTFIILSAHCRNSIASASLPTQSCKSLSNPTVFKIFLVISVCYTACPLSPVIVFSLYPNDSCFLDNFVYC